LLLEDLLFELFPLLKDIIDLPLEVQLILPNVYFLVLANVILDQHFVVEDAFVFVDVITLLDGLCTKKLGLILGQVPQLGRLV